MRARLSLSILFLAGLLVTYFRDPNLYRFPAAAYEDGRDMFGFFYNHPEPGSIFRFYNGYVSLLPNLAGYLIARAPVTAIPTLLALFPLLVAALVFAWLSRPEYSRLIAGDRLRWLACLTLALAPLGNYHFVGSTTYSVWTLFFGLILLSLMGPPESRRAAVVRFLPMAALIWSHPLSIALAPVWLAQGWAHRARGRIATSFYAALAAVAVLYQLLAVEHPGDATFDLPGIARIARVTGILVLERVFFNTLLSDRLSRVMHNRGDDIWVYLIGAAIALILVALVVLWRRRFEAPRLANLAILAYLIVALTLLYVIGRSGDLSILTGNPGYRYFWVQRLCLIVTIFVVAEPFVRGWSGRQLRVGATVLILTLALNLLWLNRTDNSKYRGRSGMGRKLAAFTERVAELESQGGPIEARLERGRWSIELKRPAPPSE